MNITMATHRPIRMTTAPIMRIIIRVLGPSWQVTVFTALAMVF
jgi:hypothetical protein